MKSKRDRKTGRGVVYAIVIQMLWFGHLTYALFFVSIGLPLVPRFGDVADVMLLVARILFHVFVQGYLYTGLFITAHDAIHGTVHQSKSINRWLGRVSAFLFAAFSYRRLHTNHMKHHRAPGGEEDPDFYPRSQNILIWFGVFFYRYATILQILLMAGMYNLLILVAPTGNVILFWIIPTFLGTFQLFYFGTFLPHRYPHTPDMEPHRARSQKKNHVFALLSCYFFGYHHEHHESPRTTWWRLYLLKKDSP